jgi:hypothetical protein
MARRSVARTSSLTSSPLTATVSPAEARPGRLAAVCQGPGDSRIDSCELFGRHPPASFPCRVALGVFGELDDARVLKSF